MQCSAPLCKLHAADAGRLRACACAMGYQWAAPVQAQQDDLSWTRPTSGTFVQTPHANWCTVNCVITVCASVTRSTCHGIPYTFGPSSGCQYQLTSAAPASSPSATRGMGLENQ